MISYNWKSKKNDFPYPTKYHKNILNVFLVMLRTRKPDALPPPTFRVFRCKTVKNGIETI